MPTTVQFRRGTTAQNDAFTGSAGELTVDTTLGTIHVHDGATVGGTAGATRAQVNDRMQVANVQSITANTNTWIARTDTNLGSTNTAIRTLVSDRIQVANVVAITGGTYTGDVFFGTNKFGGDSGDYFVTTADTKMDLYLNGSNEFMLAANGDFHADGDLVAFSTTIASDERLKDNITIVPNALEKVKALEGVTFDWKKDGSASAGVIAQRVKEVLPEAVKSVKGLKDEEEHLTVNYGALTSILIEAIKELSDKIDNITKD